MEPAKTGEISIFASGTLLHKKIMKALSAEEFSALFEKDALFIERDGEKATSSILFHLKDENNVVKMDLKPGSILVFDNYAILHGRTKFSACDYRHYKRMNCYGDGTLSNDLIIGLGKNTGLN